MKGGKQKVLWWLYQTIQKANRKQPAHAFRVSPQMQTLDVWKKIKNVCFLPRTPEKESTQGISVTCRLEEIFFSCNLMPTLKIDITQVNNSWHKTKFYGSRGTKYVSKLFIVKEGCFGSLGSDDLVFENAQSFALKKDKEFLHFYTISIIKSRLLSLIFGHSVLLQ